MMISLLILSAICQAFSAVIDFESIGGIPHNNSYDVMYSNGQLFNNTVNSLQPHDVFVIPNRTYWLIGGIIASGLTNVKFVIDGTLSFSDDRDTWPKNSGGGVEECIYLSDLTDVTFTSSGKGTLDGNGQKWWGAINYLKHHVSDISISNNRQKYISKFI